MMTKIEENPHLVGYDKDFKPVHLCAGNVSRYDPERAAARVRAGLVKCAACVEYHKAQVVFLALRFGPGGPL